MSYFFSEAARIEHLEHVAYYEAQRKGLGVRYLAAFEVAMTKVCEHPERYRVELAPGIRCYRLVGEDIEVLVVAPHRRRPDYWLGRL